MSVIPFKKATLTQYPKSKGSVRPFRLWDANAKKPVQWHCYKYKDKAHIGALIKTRWSKVGTAIEVYDCRNGKLLGQYILRVNNVEFFEA